MPSGDHATPLRNASRQSVFTRRELAGGGGCCCHQARSEVLLLVPLPVLLLSRESGCVGWVIGSTDDTAATARDRAPTTSSIHTQRRRCGRENNRNRRNKRQQQEPRAFAARRPRLLLLLRRRRLATRSLSLVCARACDPLCHSRRACCLRLGACLSRFLFASVACQPSSLPTMDAVMSSMFASALEGYFEVFFKNFRREDFKLNLSGSETTTSMHNLGTGVQACRRTLYLRCPLLPACARAASLRLSAEIREDVVQELMGVPNFGVQRVFINTLVVKVKPTAIRSQPLRIAIDRIDVVLSEPWETLQPLPKVIERFMAYVVLRRTAPHRTVLSRLRHANSLACTMHQCHAAQQGPARNLWLRRAAHGWLAHRH